MATKKKTTSKVNVFKALWKRNKTLSRAAVLVVVFGLSGSIYIAASNAYTPFPSVDKMSSLGSLNNIQILDGANIQLSGCLQKRDFSGLIVSERDRQRTHDFDFQFKASTTKVVEQRTLGYSPFIAYGPQSQISNIKQYGPIADWGSPTSGSQSWRSRISIYTPVRDWTAGNDNFVSGSGGKAFMTGGGPVQFKLYETVPNGSLSGKTTPGSEDSYMVFGYGTVRYYNERVKAYLDQTTTPIKVSAIPLCRQ